MTCNSFWRLGRLLFFFFFFSADGFTFFLVQGDAELGVFLKVFS